MEKNSSIWAIKKLSEFFEILNFKIKKLLALINGHSKRTKAILSWCWKIRRAWGIWKSACSKISNAKPSGSKERCGCSNAGYNLQRSHVLLVQLNQTQFTGSGRFELLVLDSQHRASLMVGYSGLTKIQVCFPLTPDLFLTARCESKIAYIDGEIKACFIIADTFIEQLAEKSWLFGSLLPVDLRRTADFLA